MNDNYYDQMIRERIARALKNQSREERLDLATLEQWVKEAEEKKLINRIRRWLGISN